MVIFLNLVGHAKDPLIQKLCRTLRKAQKQTGEWLAFSDQSENLSLTTLNYFALKLAGDDPKASHMVKAAGYILEHGGILNTSNLSKIYLAAAGQLPWSVLPDTHIEALLLPDWAPVTLYDFASFTRVHVPSIMILDHLQYSYPVPKAKSIHHLVDAPEKVPPTRPLLGNERAIQRARQFLLDRMESNGTIAGYLTATTMAVLALQAIGDPRDRERIQKSIKGLKSLACYDKASGVMHQQVFTSTVWDTALSVYALQESNYPTRSIQQKAAEYLLGRQQTRVSDWRQHTHAVDPGGWGFSHINTLYPDIDDTIAALRVIHPFAHKQKGHFQTAWDKGVRWLLTMQNSDGGWSAFDRNVNKAFLEKLAFNDMGRAVTDPSTADITGRVLQFLVDTDIPATQAKERAIRWLIEDQESDGSWFGRWGIAYIYGTAHALLGLGAAGVEPDHTSVKRAIDWLESIQHEDGGFGESCSSDTANHYVPFRQSTPTHTAWALLGMLATSQNRTPAIDRAAQYLIRKAQFSGGWKESYPTGAGVAGQAYIRYHSYPLVWPILALSQYRLVTRNKHTL